MGPWSSEVLWHHGHSPGCPQDRGFCLLFLLQERGSWFPLTAFIYWLYKGCHGIPEARSTPCLKRFDHAFFLKVNGVTDFSCASEIGMSSLSSPEFTENSHLQRVKGKTGLGWFSPQYCLTSLCALVRHWLQQGLNRTAKNSAAAPKLTSAFGWAEASLESCGIFSESSGRQFTSATRDIVLLPWTKDGEKYF